MPRRKQQHPVHLDAADQLAYLLDNGPQSESSGEDGTWGDEHICGKCRLEFIDLSDFLHHKRLCTRKRLVLILGDDSSDDLCAEGQSTSSVDFTEEVDKYGREIPYLCSSSFEKHDSMDSTELPPLLIGKTSQTFGGSEERPSDLEAYPKVEPTIINPTMNYTNAINKRGLCDFGVAPLAPSLPQYILNHSVPDTNVTLQTLENTRVAVAQQAAGATNVSHLAALHSALYTLQQQQIIQLQVIQQLQTQLVGTPNTVSNALTPIVATTLASLSGTAALTPPQSSDGSGGGSFALTTATPSTRPIENTTQAQNLSTTNVVSTASTTSRTSTSVTESTSTTHPLPPPPPPNEPNTLELLQRHTEQALQNTMAGSSFLLNGLSGLSNSSDILRFCKNKGDLKREGNDEAYFRHRCRFCGKVFGSDSALQIHIRSHTGERPFKCNVCGNRFSTKGNLKVHFQRHKAKYPHIKMNPHPVPLHLDSLHPPLEPPDASEPGPMMGSLTGSQSVAQSLPPPNLVPAHPLPLVSHFQDKGGETSSEPTAPQLAAGNSEEMAPHLQPRSVSPNEASNMTDDSDASIGEDYGSEENAAKDIERSRFEEELMENDEDSFSSSPKSEQKDMDENGDDESKPLTSGNTITMNSASFIPTYTSSAAPTFPSFFNPISPSLKMAPVCFPPISTPPLTSTPNSRPVGSSNNNNGNSSKPDDNEHVGPSPDPNFYQDLLPKPGSNDNSWESLMEVTKTSETSKLQQLVDNIEHKLSDPNQCVICHRVLSCKSALQMHYRTHTGERPFKCKICSRAFTTKGNLKTHMGVHRVKPPLRVLHQCPVCHKQFTNSLVLQQHIRMHTGEPTDMHPEQIMANEVRPSPLLASSFQRPLLPAMMPHFSSPSILPPHSSPVGLPPSCPTPKTTETSSLTTSPIPATESVIKTVLKPKENGREEQTISPAPSNTSRPPSVKPDLCPNPQSSASTPNSTLATTSAVISTIRSHSPSMDRPIVTTAPYSPAYTASLVALENHVKAINTTIPQSLPFSPFSMSLTMGGFLRYDDPSFLNRNQPKDMTVNRDKSPPNFASYSPSPNASHAGSDVSADERSTPGSVAKGESPISVNGSSHLSTTSGVITSKTESGALDLTPKNAVLQVPAAMPDIKLFPSPLAGLPFPTAPGRLSTTCRICFKTFACNSALEIHYRSHTKERPFKCNVCDRGFSTKGNMKQHMLTHKIRDLPPQLFTTTDSSVTSDSETNSSTNVITTRAPSPNPLSTASLIQANNSVNREKKEVTIERNTPPVITPTKITATTVIPEALPPVTTTPSVVMKSGKVEADVTSKRPLSDPNIGSSLPKRPPGLPKHFCHICQKPFSSASALQIHNRTHTGDKPFKCTICGRAFTTKGNLKVHMGTHMWNNGTSRRGRRMSLELPPLPLPPHGKHDFSHHSRQDLYFPYLPPAYINGMAGPAKMNEISVIQTAAGLTNGNPNIPVSMTLSSAVPMMTPGVTLSQPQQFMRNPAQPITDSDGGDDIEPRSPDEAENLKVQPSPSRPREMGSPGRHPIMSPSISGGGVERSANWGWKIACNVCSKICSSSSDLEAHLKSHCNPSVQDTVRSAKQPAENIAS